ncbi:helix-turn-helix domain-containing protein [Kaistella flava (ex Peng et al. 2021)]|nr:helix-turn-helix domain-containing protein [Kaistella flava (ex Peng et al. 2021)]
MVGRSIEKLHQDPDAAIRSCKNINIKDDQHYDKLIIKSILAEAYSFKGNYVDAVQIALENVNAPELLQQKDQLLINLGVIQCFQDVNLHEQSETLVTPILKDYSQAKNNKSYKSAKVYQLHASNLFALKNYDKALENIALSNNYIRFTSPNSYSTFCENKILTGKIYSQLKDYKTAERYFGEVASILKAHPNNSYLLATTYLNQSDLLFEKKEYFAAAELLEKALEKVSNADFLILKNKIYSGLAKNYLALKENDKHKDYQKKHDDSQTIIEENRKEAIRNIMKLSQGFQTQNYNTYISKKQELTYIYLGIALLIISTIFFFNYQEKQKKKMLEKQVLFFENQKSILKRKEDKIAEPEKINTKKALVIPKEKEDHLLQKLNEFEESEQFLAKNMSLALLAAQLETNTKYLSEVINKFKGKNFTTYINELKINHIAHLISSDLAYRQYKISYLAEFAGFTSHSTFTVVFKSVTGMSPNEYIQQVNKRQIR